jgi:transcriptional regulator NrdR family protein
MPKVTKRDGSVEEYIPEKIVVSIVKTGAPVDLARQIVKDVEKMVKDKTSTEEIRKKVLEDLKSKKPEYEQA